jgi:hypothetical protein
MSSTTPVNHRLLELRLMHHYTSETCRTVTFTTPFTEDIWKYTVPSLAFSGSQHLADSILALAALHLRSLCPGDRDVVRASHAYMASSIAGYSATLQAGINDSNAEALFLTSALLTYQATASRIFTRDEPSIGGSIDQDGQSKDEGQEYAVPFSWFHSFQGVKTIVAASWPYIRKSSVAIQVINSQLPLQLQIASTGSGFFDHLLEGLEDELAIMDGAGAKDVHAEPSTPRAAEVEVKGEPATPSVVFEDFIHTGTPSAPSPSPPPSPSAPREARRGSTPPEVAPEPTPAPTPSASASDPNVISTRQAYRHAVAVLNWAHKIPHKGAPLAFPATVSRRFVELLGERRPRALAILACFFALLRSLDGIWWLQGMARREVLGVAGLFSGGGVTGDATGELRDKAFFTPEVCRRWWPHLDWALRIALWEDDLGGEAIPPEVWGADWADRQTALAVELASGQNLASQIELLSQNAGGGVVDLPALQES